MDRNYTKWLQCIVNPIIKLTKGILNHFVRPWLSVGRIWAQFKAEIQGNWTKLTMLMHIMHLKCPNSWKQFHYIVFPIINNINSIPSHFRYSETSIGLIWAEFKANIHWQIDNIEPNNVFEVPNCWKRF